MEFPQLTPPPAEAVPGLLSHFPPPLLPPTRRLGNSSLTCARMTAWLSPSLTSKNPQASFTHPNPSYRTESGFPGGRCPAKGYTSSSPARGVAGPADIQSQQSQQATHKRPRQQRKPRAGGSLHVRLLYNSCFLVPPFSVGCTAQPLFSSHKEMQTPHPKRQPSLSVPWKHIPAAQASRWNGQSPTSQGTLTVIRLAVHFHAS